ncbi:MAG: glutathione binding-like protein [Gammaproteobacteria bacterium]|nr:glutathione binding-like protein [Gammaproteobacteria bacterium]MDD9863807.1 glutathione binding-like protein [Gammaproteobacteria bacterium]
MSTMKLYSRPDHPIDHMVRIVLEEKNVEVEIVLVENEIPEAVAERNPYDGILTLVDRDLALYEPQIMAEYLDERFPYPPLMPVDPVARAHNRQLRYRVMRDLYQLTVRLNEENEIAAADARKVLREHLAALAGVFSRKPYFMSDEYTLADCCMAPLLWRLPHYGIKLPLLARRSIKKYSESLFGREAFVNSLTEAEQELREPA